MKLITGEVRTNRVGSEVPFSFLVEDNISDEGIAEIVHEYAMENIEYSYSIKEVE